MAEGLMVVAGFTIVLGILAQLLRGGLLSRLAGLCCWIGELWWQAGIRIDAFDKVLSDLGRPFLRETWRGVREMARHYRGHVRQYSAELAEARER